MLFICLCCRSVEHCFHMCDRVVIYVFIAASYTPWWVSRPPRLWGASLTTRTKRSVVVCLFVCCLRLNLRELGPLAAHMRWFVWLMAAAGTIYVFNYHERWGGPRCPARPSNHSFLLILTHLSRFQQRKSQIKALRWFIYVIYCFLFWFNNQK